MPAKRKEIRWLNLLQEVHAMKLLHERFLLPVLPFLIIIIAIIFVNAHRSLSILRKQILKDISTSRLSRGYCDAQETDL